jgi:hypothetical protein
MQVGGGGIGGGVVPRFYRSGDALAVGPEAGRQRLEQRDARTGGQPGVAREDFACECDAGRLAAAGQQVLAQFGEVLGPRNHDLAAVAPAVKQRATALRNGLQHFAKEGRVHRGGASRAGGIDKIAPASHIDRRIFRRSETRFAVESATINNSFHSSCRVLLTPA